MAVKLKRDVLERVGLPITVGVARTKFLAKVASAVAKPDGLLVVPPDGELEFLHPLPVERLWGVGPATAEKLHSWGIRTVREVAELGEPALVAILGRAAGRHLHCLARNVDPRVVRVGQRRRSIGSQRALGSRRRRTHADLDADVVAIADRLGRRLRKAERVCRTVVLRLRFADFSRATRSRTLPRPTDATATILAAARGCCRGRLPTIDARGITLVGLTLTNLSDANAFSFRSRSSRRGRRRSTRRSTSCGSARDRAPSRARCCSAATRAGRRRCFRTSVPAPWTPSSSRSHRLACSG